MTECGGITLAEDYGKEFVSGNLGPIYPNCEMKFIDLNTGQSLGPNIDGEICVRGYNLFSGYLSKDGVKSGLDEGGWFHTGDIGHYNQNERIFLTDRIKEVLIGPHTECISPVEIEMFLLTHKSISEVAIVGINNKAGHHWPRAYVVLKENHSSTEEEIKTFVSDTLSKHKHLKGGVVFVDHIHRTNTGKVDRKYYRNYVKHEIID